jgi:hypothetical protein
VVHRGYSSAEYTETLSVVASAIQLPQLRYSPAESVMPPRRLLRSKGVFPPSIQDTPQRPFLVILTTMAITIFYWVVSMVLYLCMKTLARPERPATAKRLRFDSKIASSVGLLKTKN